MAGLSLIMPLLQVIYYFSKLSGFCHFYYHAEENSFKLLTYSDNRCELLFLNLISCINVAAIPVYIFQRWSNELIKQQNYSIQPGVYPPPNYQEFITDSVYALVHCLVCIVFRRNQKQFVELGNKLLVIHRALQRQKAQLRVSNMLLVTIYFLSIVIIFTVGFNIFNYCSTAQVCNGAAMLLERSTDWKLSDGAKVLMLSTFIGWNNLFYELHMQLLFIFYILISCYCRQLSDRLLKTSNKSVKRLEKVMKILPLLQTVRQQASHYFSFILLLCISELLHTFYGLLNTFKYDDDSLHPLLQQLEDLELDQKLYHDTVELRSNNVLVKRFRFVLQAIALLLELHALSVCEREHKNILDVIKFPMDTRSNCTALNAEQINELETMPDTIIVCNDVAPQINLFDRMLDTEEGLTSLSLDDTFRIQIFNLKVPLKLLKRIVNQICCSTLVIICFHKCQEIMLKKLEQIYK